MTFLKKIKYRLHRNKLERLKKKPLSDGKARHFTFDEIASVGIISNVPSEQETGVIDRFIANFPKGSSYFLFFDPKIPKKNSEISLKGVFTSRDLSFSMLPNKRNIVYDFVNKDLDLLVNLAVPETIPIEYICLRSKAKYKVSRYHDNTHHTYQLNVDVPYSTDEAGLYLDNVLLFLKKMNLVQTVK